MNKTDWPLYEVFIRSRHGLSHKHVGSVHAADETMAMENARELYTRRNEGTSIWVVASSAISASAPEQKDAMFTSPVEKIYRHPSFYQLPASVDKM